MTNDDHTIDADDSAFELIRQLATDAKSNQSDAPVGDHTIDADESTLDQIKRLAEQADGRSGGAHGSLAPPVAPPVAPPTAPRAVGQRPLPARPIEQPSLAPPPERPARRARLAGEDEGPWQPPERSMRPRADDRQAPDSARIWRLATLAMGVVVLLLAAWLVFGGGPDGSDQPTDTSVPSGVPVVGTTEDGGSGG